MIIVDIFRDLWTSELEFAGKTLISLLIFNVLFMLMGRLRFCFISNLIFLYYGFLFANRQIIERTFSDIGYMGVSIVGGALVISLSIWAFFIESD